MPDFEKVEQEAQQQAQDHSQQVDQAISAGEQQADQRTGGGHDAAVKDAGSELEKELGTDQASPPAGPGQ